MLGKSQPWEVSVYRVGWRLPSAHGRGRSIRSRPMTRVFSGFSQPVASTWATTSARFATTSPTKTWARRSTAWSTCTRSQALRPHHAAREHARHRRHAAGRRARPRPLHAVRAEPRARARRGAWLLGALATYRRAAADDAVQGQERRPGLGRGRPLHLPGAAGRRHPALPGRPRAGGRRPAPAPRADPQHRPALQRALRRDASRARGGDPVDRRRG